MGRKLFAGNKSPGVSPLLTRFLAAQLDKGRGSRSVDVYRRALALFEVWVGERKLEDLVPDDIRKYLRPIANPAYRKFHLIVIRQYYEWFNAAGLMSRHDYNPARVVTMPKVPKGVPRAITESEEATLMTAAKTLPEMYLVCRLMRYSGLRLGEVAGDFRRVYNPHEQRFIDVHVPGIKIENFDSKSLRLIVRGKGGDEMTAELDVMTASLLEDHIGHLHHREPNAPIFQARSGLPRGYPWAMKQWGRIREIAQITRRVTPHMLRHTAGTVFLETTGDLEATKKFLRHKSLQSTLIYAGNRDKSFREKYDRFVKS